MATADLLTTLNNIKTGLRGAINSNLAGNLTASTPFGNYKDAILNVDLQVGWVRPADWLPIPAPASGTQMFKGLLAIFPDDGNMIAVNAYANYTVDWGDGSPPENFATNVKAYHTYDYASISDATICSRGYKQVVVTITPQSGNNLTFVSTAVTPLLWTSAYQSAPWLDISINAPLMTAIQIGASSIKMGMLERLRIGQNIISTWAYAMANCYVLRICEIAFGATMTGVNTGMYLNCYLLEVPPLPAYLGGVTGAHSMLLNTVSMKYLSSAGSFSACQNFTLFASGSGLVEATIDMSAATTCNSALSNNYAMRKAHITANPSLTTVDYGSIFTNAGSLVDCVVTGCRNSISIAGSKMSATAINTFLTSLGNGAGKTATIAGAFGAATCDRSIATTKNWTVTG